MASIGDAATQPTAASGSPVASRHHDHRVIGAGQLVGAQSRPRRHRPRRPGRPAAPRSRRRNGCSSRAPRRSPSGSSSSSSSITNRGFDRPRPVGGQLAPRRLSPPPTHRPGSTNSGFSDPKTVESAGGTSNGSRRRMTSNAGSTSTRSGRAGHGTSTIQSRPQDPTSARMASSWPSTVTATGTGNREGVARPGSAARWTDTRHGASPGAPSSTRASWISISRRAGALHPLLDKGRPITAGGVGEGLREVGKGGAVKTVLTIEERERLEKALVTDRTAGHVEEHQTLAVADRFRGRGLARTKSRRAESRRPPTPCR